MKPGGGPVTRIAELPESLYELLGRRLGGVARTIVVPGSAFSSTVAGVVDTGRWGRVFVKAAARDAWMAEDYRVEQKALRAMPGDVRAPSLLALLEDDHWVVLCLSVVCGRVVQELAEREATWSEATAGRALLHFDPRTDNQLLDEHGDAWLLDWSRACLGAPWVDLVTWAPSVHAAGHDMSATLSSGALCGAAAAEQVDALLAALAGYWLDVSATPDPAAPRLFQRRSAEGALDLLHHRLL